ncbi:MAG: GvpL/GvpF family gas vesicle protein [Acidobacteria bacterium]|nr:GvpL/GvpF family gas vesicle protein [Acidobacteriota bacterium]
MNEPEIADPCKPTEAASTNSAVANYLFCLARHSLVLPIGACDIAGWGPIFLWRYLDIAAVLTTVSLAEFCGQTAEARMQDLSWLGPRACRHEEVIEQVIRHSPVLPAPFGTLFTSIDKVELLLKQHYTAISEFLDSVTGTEEWAVKGLLERATARKTACSVALAEQEKRLACASPGTRYVNQQRLQEQVDREVMRWTTEICTQALNDLSARACQTCERKVITHRAEGADMDVILNWAFLVPHGAVGDFHSQIARLNACHAARGLVFQVSGPWPPYSFSPALTTAPAA